MIIPIGSKLIGENNPCFIIAEAGVNHNGNIKLAKKLIDIAKDAGVDAVKFQTWITEEIMIMDSTMAEYAQRNTKETSQYQMLKNLELSYTEFEELKRYCDEKKIIFLSTPDEEKSVEFLSQLGVLAFKIGSGELNNPFMLERIARKNLPIILSTGMGSLEEVNKAVQLIKSTGNNKLVLLHCTTEYPAPLSDINLLAMQTLAKEFKTIVGYSDHTEGILVPALAVAAGASVIEKHFTYDKNADGPDHKASLNPKELKEMVQLIRKTEMILGNPIKKPSSIESKNKIIVRKSIVSRQDIPKGTKIDLSMLTAKRPGTGISPAEFKSVIGKITKNRISKDTIINFEMLK